ncbi:MAG: hypothetical protein AAF456_22005 [Planctomycetota bacterium]
MPKPLRVRLLWAIIFASSFVLSANSTGRNSVASPVPHQDEEENVSEDNEGQVKVEVLADGLNQPYAVAVNPDSGTVFVSDSGAGRVVRVVDGAIEEVITGYPMGKFGSSESDVGPLGLAFIDGQNLVVGSGGDPDGNDQLRVYPVSENGQPAVNFDGTPVETSDEDSDEDGDDSVADDDSDSTEDESGSVEGEATRDDESLEAEASSPEEGSEEASEELPAQPIEAYSLSSDEGQAVEGEFYGIIASDRNIYVTGAGDEAKGWVSRADVLDGKLTNFSRSIATSEQTGTSSPTAIARSPEGFIVVSQIGQNDDSADSVISFYDESNEELGNSVFETGLNEIRGLAYGPVRGRLFAVDMSLANPESAGLYKLVSDGGSGCKAELIIELDRPTALAFDQESNLYVTVLGPADSEQPGGQLLKITGLDIEPSSEDN